MGTLTRKGTIEIRTQLSESLKIILRSEAKNERYNCANLNKSFFKLLFMGGNVIWFLLTFAFLAVQK